MRELYPNKNYTLVLISFSLDVKVQNYLNFKNLTIYSTKAFLEVFEYFIVLNSVHGQIVIFLTFMKNIKQGKVRYRHKFKKILLDKHFPDW